MCVESAAPVSQTGAGGNIDRGDVRIITLLAAVGLVIERRHIGGCAVWYVRRAA